MAFCAVLAVANERMRARKAAEKLAPRPLIVGIDFAHRFR
jgi:hypothetical protein